MKAGYCTPMLHVVSIERSIAFYQRLGFELIDTEGESGRIGWARMHCEGGALMFLPAEDDEGHGRSDAGRGPQHDRVLFYLYTPDLPGLRQELLAAGVEVSEISHPAYMPSGEVCLKDRDGYTVLIAHWSDKEHQEWLRQLEEKKQAGLLP